MFSFDCESTSLNWLDLKMIGFSIADGKQACYVTLLKQSDNIVLSTKYKKELLSILDYYIQESKMIIMHNSPFDTMCLKKEGIEI